MGINKQDFIGFTFNGRHSSEFNILSVTSGDRYQDSLVPSFTAYTEKISGATGQNYYGTDLESKEFSLNIAYDRVSEANLRELRNWFKPGTIGELIFDERPYKVYTARIAEPPQLSYLCFSDKGNRLYKGEGSLKFICDYPLARTSGEKKELKNYPIEGFTGIFTDYQEDSVVLSGDYLYPKNGKYEDCTYSNYFFKVNQVVSTRGLIYAYERQSGAFYKSWNFSFSDLKAIFQKVIPEWANSTGLLDSLTGYDSFFVQDGAVKAKVYNPSDNEVGFILEIPKTGSELKPITFSLLSKNGAPLGKSFTLSLRTDSSTDSSKYGEASILEQDFGKLPGIIEVNTNNHSITFSTSENFYTYANELEIFAGDYLYPVNGVYTYNQTDYSYEDYYFIAGEGTSNGYIFFIYDRATGEEVQKLGYPLSSTFISVFQKVIPSLKKEPIYFALKEGDFYNIPQNYSTDDYNLIELQLSETLEEDDYEKFRIDYDYLYF